MASQTRFTPYVAKTGMVLLMRTAPMITTPGNGDRIYQGYVGEYQGTYVAWVSYGKALGRQQSRTVGTCSTLEQLPKLVAKLNQRMRTRRGQVGFTPEGAKQELDPDQVLASVRLWRDQQEAEHPVPPADAGDAFALFGRQLLIAA